VIAHASLAAVAARRPTSSHQIAGPWSPQFHPVTLGIVVVLVALYLAVARGESRPTKRQKWAFAAAAVALLLAGSWPLEDLAAHWSLTALVLQRLLLILVAAPMLLVSVPTTLAAKLTRPSWIDSVLALVTRPVAAIVIFTVVAVGTLLTPAVAAQTSSPGARVALDAVLFLSGIVLWAPVIKSLPGSNRPSALGRAVYLFVQSVIPGFPSIIFIFAHHQLYPGFAHVHAVFGMSPLVDQQIAGVVAKVATIPVLWSVAWVALSEAQRADREGIDTEPLTWAEVQRQLERVERAERSLVRRGYESSSPPTPPDDPPDRPFDGGS
jgi:cytochrome c oxidase assembly factor CtaG